jgi:Condensation domain
MTDLAKRIAALSPEKRQLLLQHLQQNKKENFAQNDITPQNRDTNTFPLSFAQQRLWFIDQLEPGNIALNLSLSIGLTGSLNVKALEASFQEIVNRHEVLRTTFTTLQGQPVQVISPNLSLELPIIDLQKVLADERESKMLQLATAEAHQPFDLSKDTLLRVTLLQLAKSEYALLLTMHHIISDGWSVGVLVREVATLYEAYSHDKRTDKSAIARSLLPELPIQYVDFAIWQRKWLQGEKLETQLAYWKQQLGGELPVLQLPTDFPRPAIQTFRGDREFFVLPKDVLQKLKVLYQSKGITLFMVLLAAFQILLHWYTGQEDIVIGTDIANRNQDETKGLIGFFVNQLALRTNLSGNPSFRELLEQVYEITIEAYVHQDLPFDKLVEFLNPRRNLDRTPLFQVKIVLENTQIPSINFADITVTPIKVDKKAVQFDLLIELTEIEDGLHGIWLYNTDIFKKITISRMSENFQAIVDKIVTQPEIRLNQLKVIISELEQQRHLVQKQTYNSKIQQGMKNIKRKVNDKL